MIYMKLPGSLFNMAGNPNVNISGNDVYPPYLNRATGCPNNTFNRYCHIRGCRYCGGTSYVILVPDRYLQIGQI